MLLATKSMSLWLSLLGGLQLWNMCFCLLALIACIQGWLCNVAKAVEMDMSGQSHLSQ